MNLVEYFDHNNGTECQTYDPWGITNGRFNRLRLK